MWRKKELVCFHRERIVTLMQSFHFLTNDLELLLLQTNFPSDDNGTLLKQHQISFSRGLWSFTRNCFVKGNMGNFKLNILLIQIKSPCGLCLMATALLVLSLLKKPLCQMPRLTTMYCPVYYFWWWIMSIETNFNFQKAKFSNVKRKEKYLGEASESIISGKSEVQWKRN